MGQKVIRRQVDHRQLCIEADRTVEEEVEPQYEFSNGRKFVKPKRSAS